MVRFQNTQRLNRSGFTLVELLIVVAIIGVLSTIGVPTFRRMVQKSKKSEAKVSLGGLYTSEQAFFAEYGAYGNQVYKIGYETDGAANVYTVGFPTGTCGNTNGVEPQNAAGHPIGTNLFSVYPNYFTAPALPLLATVIQSNPVMTTGCGAAITAAYNGLFPGTPGAPTKPGAVSVYNSAAAGAEDDNFVATASGVIAPSVSKTAPNPALTDIWAISNQRTLVNIQDGVN